MGKKRKIYFYQSLSKKTTAESDLIWKNKIKIITKNKLHSRPLEHPVDSEWIQATKRNQHDDDEMNVIWIYLFEKSVEFFFGEFCLNIVNFLYNSNRFNIHRRSVSSSTCVCWFCSWNSQIPIGRLTLLLLPCDIPTSNVQRISSN